MIIIGAATAIAIGLATAIVELLARYRAYPVIALSSLPGIIYLAVNGLASAAVYCLSVALDWSFGLPDASALGVTIVRVLVAGFGTMALLRSSLLTFSQGQATIDAGPGAVLASLKGLIDDSVDRRHAQALLQTNELEGLSFQRDHEMLTLLTSTALVDPDPDIARDLGTFAGELEQSEVSDAVKLHAYAMKLVEVVGPGPVRSARTILLSQAREPGAQKSPYVAQQPSEVSPEEQSWEEAQTLCKLLSDRREQMDESLRVHLGFRLAKLVEENTNFVAPAIYSRIELKELSIPFGAETVWSTDSRHVRWRLVDLLVAADQPIVGSSRAIHKLPGWLVATVLRELSLHLEDKESFTEEVLDTSVELCPMWDVLVVRAALHLRLGNVAKAAADLDEARGGSRTTPEDEVRVVPIGRYSDVLDPLRATLDPNVEPSTRVALWNSAVREWKKDDWSYSERRVATVETTAAPEFLESPIGHSKMISLVTEFIENISRGIPPRSPGRLNLENFPWSGESGVVLPSSLRERLVEYADRTPKPTTEDFSLPRDYQNFALALRDSLDTWQRKEANLKLSSITRAAEWERGEWI